MNQNKSIKILVFFFIFILFLICFSYTTSAADITVGTTGDYQFIQDAINNSNAGDTIYIWAGTYTERYIHINRSLDIIGNYTDTIIQGPDPAASNKPAFYIQANYTNISSIKFYNWDYWVVQSQGSPFYGSNPDGPHFHHISVFDCYFQRNRRCIDLTYRSNISIYNNTFDGDGWYYAETGVWTISGIVSTALDNFTIYNNTFLELSTGIYITDTSSSQNGLIYNNHFTDINTTSIKYEDTGSTNISFNMSKTLGTNIIGGSYLGGNYYSNYTGNDWDRDGLGDDPVFFLGGIDYHPLGGSDYLNITINVYNESSPSTAIPDWNIRIYDSNNTIQYSKNTLNNPVTINHTDCGTGNLFFEIGASGYYNRTYYHASIENGTNYILDAFLLNTANTDANIYTCIVVDDSDLDHILYINDATISITRVINGSVHEIASGFTDGSGRFYVPLIAGVSYMVNITAAGYDNLYDTYIPSSTEFEQTFRMTPTTPTSTSYDVLWDDIIISISMVSAGCMQDGNITITYLDSNSSTTNTEIQLWEIYGTTNTLLNTWTNTSNSFFNINGSINTTRVHYIVIFFNNTADFTITQPITIVIFNVDSPFCDRVDPFDLDDRITKIVGPFTIDGQVVPWTVIIGSIVPIIFLVAFGPFNTGLGIICCGVSMSMLQSFLHMYVTGGFQWGILGIGAFITILGIMYVMTKGTGGDHL